MVASTAAAPAMSVFIDLHAAGRLDRDAAGVEDDALADEDDVRPARAALRAVRRARRAAAGVRTLADADQAAEALGRQLALVPNAYLLARTPMPLDA